MSRIVSSYEGTFVAGNRESGGFSPTSLHGMKSQCRSSPLFSESCYLGHAADRVSRSMNRNVPAREKMANAIRAAFLSIPIVPTPSRAAPQPRSNSTTDMAAIRIGIGGWTFAPWRGLFYPDKLPQSKELEYASRELGAIEINATFYGRQKPKS